jgi:hypothetical protein
MKRSLRYLFTAALIALICLGAEARKKNAQGVVAGHPALAPYFSDPEGESLAPDSQGFIRRWLLLEPILKPNRTNTVFTDSYIRETFGQEMFPGYLTVLPENGKSVKVGDETLTWHALDSKLFNVKLYRYATGMEKERYGIIFWAVTVLDVPETLENVRLSAGSNSASMWWIDGEEVLILSGDRRMVMDDGASSRLTLTKGRHILRCAVINGPGMSDFCVRFVDESGKPVTSFKTLNK